MSCIFCIDTEQVPTIYLPQYLKHFLYLVPQDDGYIDLQRLEAETAETRHNRYTLD